MFEDATPEVQAQDLAHRLQAFIAPFLDALDTQLDRRLVRTVPLALHALVKLRHTKYGLLLSELGGQLLSPAHAPAGTKRLSNLLRSPRWSHTAIEEFLWQQADTQLATLQQQGRTALLLWDSSVLEKPESVALEGLGSVRSSKAARLSRIKPGFYRPPGPPVFVPGMQWLSVLLAGMEGASQVACMRWWTNRGPHATDGRSQERALLHLSAARWGQQVVHVFDRGFAGSPWLGELGAAKVRFVLRWPTRYQLLDTQGARAAWQITRGKRSQDHRLLWDVRRRRQCKTGIITVPVRHPALDQPLWLVVSRPGKGRRPWYLLTNQPITTLDDAWRVVLAYARRWQVEMAYRYGKTELAMESPRLWKWENRCKLLLLVTLVYSFLLTLVRTETELVAALLHHWCPRTGKRHRLVAVPLYRLRAALSQLWLFYLPHPPLLRRNSG